MKNLNSDYIKIYQKQIKNLNVNNLQIFNQSSILFSPIILIFRLIKKKEHKNKFKEKFCFFQKQEKVKFYGFMGKRWRN